MYFHRKIVVSNGSIVIYGDNWHYHATRKRGFILLSKLAERFQRAFISMKSILNKDQEECYRSVSDLLTEGMNGGCKHVDYVRNSLCATFENFPYDLAKLIAKFAKKCPDILKTMSNCICDVGNLGNKCAKLILGMEASRFPTMCSINNEINLTSTEILVDAFITNRKISAYVARRACVSIFKYIKIVRSMLWNCSDRLMLLCVTGNSTFNVISLDGVLKGGSPNSRSNREMLIQSLCGNKNIGGLFSREGCDSGYLIANEDDDKSIFFLFSFSSLVQSKALPVLKQCLEQGKIQTVKFGSVVAKLAPENL